MCANLVISLLIGYFWPNYPLITPNIVNHRVISDPMFLKMLPIDFSCQKTYIWHQNPHLKAIIGRYMRKSLDVLIITLSPTFRAFVRP